MAEKAPEEASAAMRAMARTVRDWYVALIGEGFTSSEALIIVGQLLRAAVDKGPQS